MTQSIRIWNENNKPICGKTVKKNGGLFFDRILERKTVCMRRLGNDRTETVKFERWLRNRHVTVNRLIKTEQERIRELVVGREILAIQDTTELNYQKHAGRVHGLGTVGNGKDVGFFIHPLLVMDAHTDACLGSAAVHIENRLEGASEDYRKLPIEEKESYKWISTAEKSKSILSKAKRVTFIADRENDIYEFIDRIPDKNIKIITRIRHDRSLENGEKLYSYIEKQKEAGKMGITIPREIRKGRKEREVLLSIRYDSVEITKPKRCSDKEAKNTIKVHIVEAKETNCPIGKESVHWRLLTTHEICNLNDAMQIICWYKKRWNVEQIFRLMKKQGLDVESSQVESAECLMKLAVIALCAAVQILQLVLAREGTTEQKTSDVFSIEEQVVLTALLKTVEGKTAKQKNPYPKENLGWASWIIARLGAWHGYKSSEGLPGPIVMGRGLARFQGIYDGWKLCTHKCGACKVFCVTAS